MQNYSKEIRFWKKTWVASIVMLPSYLLVAIALSRLQGWQWFIGVIFGLWLIGKAYIEIVLKKRIMKSWGIAKIAISMFFGQVLIVALTLLLIQK